MHRCSLLPVAITLCALTGLGCQQRSDPSPAGQKAGRAERVGPILEQSEEALRGIVVEDGRVRLVGELPTTPKPPALTTAELERRVRRLLHQDREEQALRLAVQVARATPEDAGALRVLSFALRRAGRLEVAAAAARTAIDLEPGDAGSHMALARSLEQAGRYLEAISAWLTAEALQPTEDGQMATVQRRLAALHVLTGDRQASARHAEAAPDTNWPLAATETGADFRKAAGLAVTLGPAVRIDTGGGTSDAAEVSLAATADGSLVAAWNDLRQATAGEWRLGWARSDDGGLSWTDDVLRPPGALPTDFEGDPMTAYDPRTGTLWVGGTQFFVDELYLSRRPAGAPDFTPPAIVAEGIVLDRAQLAVGLDPSSPQDTLLHMAHITGLQTSADLGDTWGPIVTWAEGGFAHHPATGTGGEVYTTYADFDDRIIFQRSFDGGATLGPAVDVAIRMDTWGTQDGSRFPGRFRVAPLPYLASSPVDGTLYCLYFDTTEVIAGQANVDLYLTLSIDRGDTWSTPAVVNGDADPPGDQFLPWIEVDDAGRIHLAFFDTRNTPQLDDVLDGQIDVYHSVSADGGATWTETRLTTEPFSTDVIMWPGFPDLQFLGENLGLATAGGRTWVAYPSTENGDLDIFVREVTVGGLIFADGFESGGTSAWSSGESSLDPAALLDKREAP